MPHFALALGYVTNTLKIPLKEIRWIFQMIASPLKTKGKSEETPSFVRQKSTPHLPSHNHINSQKQGFSQKIYSFP